MPNKNSDNPATHRTADRLAIAETLYLHSRGLDRLDAAAIRGAYWPESEVDYGSYKGNAHVFAELVVDALSQQYELTRHSLSNTLIELTGNSALCESYVHAGHLLPRAKEELLFYGRYLDKMEKRGSQWKILHRQVVVDWIKRHPVVDERDSEAFNALAKGARRESDPLYSFLQTREI
ncbi:MAG: nuclear transport factor 2 family protein [Halioglobus sp.]|nr:nuclear transport factor 2 family protein [Halioglobus sp.]